MQHSREFLQLQIDFANHLALVSKQPLSIVLREHTVLSHILKMSGDSVDALWKQFVQGLQENGNFIDMDFAYTFYLQRQALLPEDPDDQSAFGCFSYIYPYRDARAVRLHFANHDASGKGALSLDRVEARKAELKQLFQHVSLAHPEAEEVWGGSWLYHIEAYKRLFPPDYVAHPTSAGYETGFFALWGQFVGRENPLREPTASQFLHCVRQQTDLNACLECFPYDVLRVKCRISAFNDFFEIADPDLQDGTEGDYGAI